MCGIGSCVFFPVAFALTVPAQVLVVALRSVAEVATFYFSASFGVFLVLHRDFALALECLGCACGVAF